jgi:hypothetical protein
MARLSARRADSRDQMDLVDLVRQAATLTLFTV